MNDTNTKTDLDELFSLMEIKHVICVDDQYRIFSEEAVNEIIGFCSELGTKKVVELSKKVPELVDILFREDEDIWNKQLRQLWLRLDKDKRGEIYNLFEKDSPGESSMDMEVVGALGELLEPSAVQYLELSFTKWKDKEVEYLEEENVAKTLFLFDRDLSHEMGGTPDEGIKIIKKVLAKRDEAICGLLSHTFTAEDEVTKWESFSNLHDIDKDRFVLISKDRLKSNKDDFFRSLKLTALNKHCKNMKERISRLLEDSAKESRKEIEALKIYDFEHIVFRSSYNEGIWEPDTLFRLNGLFQRDAARRKAKNDDELHKLANKIRNVALIAKNQPTAQSGTSWKIQRRELYEDEGHINSLHMPLELGDIFEKTNNVGKKFILLAQPCDLMIRPDGKRKHTVDEAILAEIERPSDKHKNKAPLEQVPFYRLLYFDKKSGVEHFVNFNKIHTVKLCVLDLCVYQFDGSAQISVGQNCPDIVIPAWKSHFQYLYKDFQKTIKRYKEFEGHLKEVPKKLNKDILSMVLPKSSNGKKVLFKERIQLSKKETSISYDCRRIGRLCQPRTGDMLMKYAQHMSRMAFEHDFARDIK